MQKHLGGGLLLVAVALTFITIAGADRHRAGSPKLGETQAIPSSTPTKADPDPPSKVRLSLRPPDDDLLVDIGTYSATGPIFALAYHYRARVYSRPDAKARSTGYIRRGRTIDALHRVSGTGCKGRWYKTSHGYICSSKGFIVSRKRRTWPGSWPQPNVSKALPYSYAERLKEHRGAPRFYRLPTKSEWKKTQNAKPSKLPEVVESLLDGDYLMSLNRIETVDGRRFYRTVRGRYVAEAIVKPFKPSPMHGELLSEELTLPLAFVFGADRPIFRATGHDDEVDSLERVGTAEKHARFQLQDEINVANKDYVRSKDSLLLKREHVRLIEKIARPKGVPAGQNWIHIDLSEQALVAYEGDTPVFATLVSSGRPGYETARGLFRIVQKHVTSTMAGDDDKEGHYEVADVPWTMFYWESYALHGAYWHNDFGQSKSHGCTNIAPIDARWLFYWSSPRVPKAFHGVHTGRGTWVYFSA